jgi:hypothetical protein
MPIYNKAILAEQARSLGLFTMQEWKSCLGNICIFVAALIPIPYNTNNICPQFNRKIDEREPI